MKFPSNTVIEFLPSTQVVFISPCHLFHPFILNGIDLLKHLKKKFHTWPNYSPPSSFYNYSLRIQDLLMLHIILKKRPTAVSEENCRNKRKKKAKRTNAKENSSVNTHSFTLLSNFDLFDILCSPCSPACLNNLSTNVCFEQEGNFDILKMKLLNLQLKRENSDCWKYSQKKKSFDQNTIGTSCFYSKHFDTLSQL